MTAALFTLSVFTFSASGAAWAASHVTAQGSKTFILNLDMMSSLNPAGGPAGADPWLGLGASSSPSGAVLPDVSGHFDVDGMRREVTYFTPRVDGVQVNVTRDRPSSAGGGEAAARERGKAPNAVGANLSKNMGSVELSLGGDYGRTPKTVPGAVRLVEDHKLLRVGAHARRSALTIGGSLGGDVDPNDPGDTVSWDAFARYDTGSLSMGLVYSYLLKTDDETRDEEGFGGTIQGGVSYAFSPRIAASTNFAFGNYVSEDGGAASDLAGVVGLSVNF